MSLWDQIASREQLLTFMNTYYAEKCQAEVRYLFAVWIEAKIMSEKNVTTNEATFEQAAISFVEGLLNEMRNYTSIDQQGKLQLEQISKTIGQYPPVEFYSHLRNGLERELQLIDALRKGNSVVGSVGNINGIGTGSIVEQNDDIYKVGPRIQELQQQTTYSSQEVNNFRLNCEKLQIEYNDFNRSDSLGMNAQQKDVYLASIKTKLDDDYRIIVAHKMTLTSGFKRIIEKYDEVQTCVVDKELKNWQRNQALGGNGAPYIDNLDTIQRWIEHLVEIICKFRNQINMMITITTQCNFNLGDISELREIFQHVKNEQERLILSAFIVEKQPPQVMKTNTRFAATVRWLIGPQLGISMANPTVECIILSEAQAQRHCAQRQMSESTPHSSGEILNNVGSMELQQQTRHFAASFRNMQLKKIKRAEKKGTESVMDEKFALLFYTTSVVNDYRIRAWTLSLPVVVIVHGNQEPQSWATITWDNAFSEINREPFQVPDRVLWSQLSCALNTKFASQTKRALSEENMHFLYEKIVRGDIIGDHKDYVSWGQFCKEPLPDRTFTFWDWFFAIMKLTKDHLLGPWQAGRIIGFINKKKTTDEILKQCPAGTFLLRFSDSELGGITIAWVNECSNVYMLQPWTARDLNVLGLADRIRDLDQLRFLYPNINKDEAFRDFYPPVTEEKRGTGGYVINKIKATIPEMNHQYSSYPNTPQHNMQSPNPTRDMTSSMSSDAFFQNNANMVDFSIFSMDDIPRME